jgi:hypothetical protein
MNPHIWAPESPVVKTCDSHVSRIYPHPFISIRIHLHPFAPESQPETLNDNILVREKIGSAKTQELVVWAHLIYGLGPWSPCHVPELYFYLPELRFSVTIMGIMSNHHHWVIKKTVRNSCWRELLLSHPRPSKAMSSRIMCMTCAYLGDLISVVDLTIQPPARASCHNIYVMIQWR